MITGPRARWLALLPLFLATACGAGRWEVAHEDFRGTVAGHPEGTFFADEQVDQLLATLDSVLALPETVKSFRRQGQRYLQGFRWALGKGLVTQEQSRRVGERLEDLKADHPRHDKMIDEQRRLLVLTPGQVAQNIVGTDTDGVRFALEEYRGNIVVLIFSGEWCGPCREEYPYQREMLERYEGENVVLLGVNSDDELETAREAKERERLHYRTWWDGGTNGPISTAWDVWAWPSTFILDAEGVIRFLDRRAEGMSEAVDQLLDETRADGSQEDGFSNAAYRAIDAFSADEVRERGRARGQADRSGRRRAGQEPEPARPGADSAVTLTGSRHRWNRGPPRASGPPAETRRGGPPIRFAGQSPAAASY